MQLKIRRSLLRCTVAYKFRKVCERIEMVERNKDSSLPRMSSKFLLSVKEDSYRKKNHLHIKLMP